MFCASFPAVVLLLSTWVLSAAAECNSHSPAFPLPRLSADDPEIRAARDDINEALADLFRSEEYDTFSYSIEITSSTDTLLEHHRTASEHDKSRPGTKAVDGSSRYRIASITKTFTVLALIQQQIAGRLDLDDPINKYIPELGEKSKGGIPWKDISLKTLASQLSGIPRDLTFGDLLVSGTDPNKYGLPPISRDGLAQCDAAANYTKVCSATELLSYLDHGRPIFPPKQQSTYSNMNFELLGLAIQNVTGMEYEEYVSKYILQELNMTSTSFSTPNDSVSVLPKDGISIWDLKFGVQNPTGGLYSSSSDLARFARYVLTHYNGLSPALNWLNPVSYGTGINSFYGMPWEIFRTNDMLPYTSRPITFVTKGGGLPGYTSAMVMIPEYGMGFAVLVGGNSGTIVPKILSIVGLRIVEAVDAIAQRQAKERHVGTFSAPSRLHLNSSITVSHSLERGLYISSWTSNSTNTLEAVMSLFNGGSSSDLDAFRLQLVPTLLFKDEAERSGEIWRFIRARNEPESAQKGPFDKFCITDIDGIAYGTVPLTEAVFWSEDKDGVFQDLELSAFRVKLRRTAEEKETSKPKSGLFTQHNSHAGSVYVNGFQQAMMPL